MNNEKYVKLDQKRGVDYIGVCCVFFCHDGQGNVLLHKRSSNCRDEQGTWDCGGGSMEHGETFEETIRREIKEELLVDPDEVKHVVTENVLRDNNGTPTHWVAVLHVVKVDPEKVGIGEPDKIDEIGWFHPDDFPEPLHSMMKPHFAKVRHLL